MLTVGKKKKKLFNDYVNTLTVLLFEITDTDVTLLREFDQGLTELALLSKLHSFLRECSQ